MQYKMPKWVSMTLTSMQILQMFSALFVNWKAQQLSRTMPSKLQCKFLWKTIVCVVLQTVHIRNKQRRWRISFSPRTCCCLCTTSSRHILRLRKKENPGSKEFSHFSTSSILIMNVTLTEARKLSGRQSEQFCTHMGLGRLTDEFCRVFSVIFGALTLFHQITNYSELRTSERARYSRYSSRLLSRRQSLWIRQTGCAEFHGSCNRKLLLQTIWSISRFLEVACSHFVMASETLGASFEVKASLYKLGRSLRTAKHIRLGQIFEKHYDPTIRSESSSHYNFMGYVLISVALWTCEESFCTVLSLVYTHISQLFEHSAIFTGHFDVFSRLG